MAAIARSAELHDLTARCTPDRAGGNVADTELRRSGPTSPPGVRHRPQLRRPRRRERHGDCPRRPSRSPSSRAASPGPPPTSRCRATMVDWEVEIVVVIGRPCADVAVADAWDARGRAHARPGHLRPPGAADRVAAAVLAGQELPRLRPASARRWCRSTRSPTRTTSACGATSPASACRTSRTANLIFSIPTLVAYLSSICTLEPGDLIFTGTPDGVGMATGRFLARRRGDRLGCRRDRRAAQPLRARLRAGGAVSLHRLLGLHTSVPDPDGLTAFYRELGLPAMPAAGSPAPTAARP